MNKISRHCRAVFAGFASALSAAALAAEPSAIEIRDAWVRALPPTQSNTAAYMTVENRGALATDIVGATASVAERVEIHTTRQVDGFTRMEQLPQLQIPAGASQKLSPGGTHFMLLQLERMPAVGESVTLCLQFEAAGRAADSVAEFEVCTQAPVQRGPAENHEHHHHS